MLDNSVRDVYLVDEFQLGSKLNESLHAGHRSEFSLLLSLLSPDVLDAAQFYDKNFEPTDEDLREKFNLQPEIKKYADESDFAREAVLSDVLDNEGMTAVHLYNALERCPLVPREEYIKDVVVSQLPPLSREKLRAYLEDRKIPRTPIMEHGEGFLLLEEIKQSRVGESNTPSIEVHV